MPEVTHWQGSRKLLALGSQSLILQNLCFSPAKRWTQGLLVNISHPYPRQGGRKERRGRRGHFSLS